MRCGCSGETPGCAALQVFIHPSHRTTSRLKLTDAGLHALETSLGTPGCMPHFMPQQLPSHLSDLTSFLDLNLAHTLA